MIKLNDNNLIVGQIKQLLHTFNLPQCQVGSTYPKANRCFITRDHVMRWDETLQPQVCDKYVYGQEYLNLTATLPIRNMTYDRETHRYLGKYLRFLRDYNGINLMSMYNCCDGEFSTYPLTFDIEGNGGSVRTVAFKNGSDSCNVYRVPVSINTFTISSHSAHVLEVCVLIDNAQSENINIIREIAKRTYKRRKVLGCFHYSPFELIKDESLSKFIMDHINEVCLLVKISDALATSLVVLEGDYIDNIKHKQAYFTYKPSILLDMEEASMSLLATIGKSIQAAREDKAYIIKDTQRWVANIRTNDGKLLLASPASRTIDGAPVDSGYVIASQLLSQENTTSGFILGDRLIEYLVGNAVTPLSADYEIARVQKALNMLRPRNSIADVKLAPLILDYRSLYGQVVRPTNPPRISDVEEGRYIGIWHKSDFQDLRAIAHKSDAVLNFDTVGYLDKDMEAILKGVIDNVQI